jgi:hypothetical protein
MLGPSPSSSGRREGRGCRAAARPVVAAHTRRTVRASASLWVSSSASREAGRCSSVGVVRRPRSSFSLYASERGGLPRGRPETITTSSSAAAAAVPALCQRRPVRVAEALRAIWWTRHARRSMLRSCEIKSTTSPTALRL